MERTKKASARGSLLLALTSLIWGVAFVAQSDAMNYVGGFTFVGCRYLLGGTVLLPVIFAIRTLRHSEYEAMDRKERERYDRAGITGGICCGLCLFVATSLQQFGVAHTTVAKAGFITTLYIVLVPLFGFLLHRKVGPNIWGSVALAVVGMYLLCIKDGFVVEKGDVLIFLCAFMFTFHIMSISYVSPKADGVVISCVQFFTAGILGCIAMFLVEKPQWSAIMAARLPILFAGVMSSGVGYTLQVIGQRDLDPAVASLILSMESVFSLLAGWILLGQKLSLRELGGCALVFAAIVLVQIPWERLSHKQKNE